MLVLSRKQAERILIGSHVEIVVVAIQGNRVRLGITADAETRICRSELFLTSHSPQPDHPFDLNINESSGEVVVC